MRRVFIVQARMTSTRLPGKVLMDLDGAPMLARQLARLRRCRTADEIVVATTSNAEDDPVVRLCDSEGARWFRGSERDVLSRYLGAAREARADWVVRVTGDCPLVCPEVCDRVVESLGASGCEYAANTLRRTYPRGLDCEAATLEALERAGREAKSPASREHVTYFLHSEAKDRFRLASVEDSESHSDLRWTVDEAADLEAVRRLWSGAGLSARALGYREILAFALAHPEIGAINASVEQKPS